MKMKNTLVHLAIMGSLSVASSNVLADSDHSKSCAKLPAWSTLQGALKAAQNEKNGGFGLNMWATVVGRDGTVCAVAYSGANSGSQWPGSRVISAQKANTANAFGLDTLALSTANLYSATQPGGTLYGLQASNPVNTEVAYRGDSARYGAVNDPMVGGKIGGVNVFGGGLGLYDVNHKIIGAVGVSGDSSCADHNIAWRVRNNLKLDNLTGVNGVSGDSAYPDNIVYDILSASLATTVDSVNNSASGWGHPSCTPEATKISSVGLPPVR